MVSILSDSVDGRKYWNKLKQRLTEEENETVTNCLQLKMPAGDGKMRLTDVATRIHDKYPEYPIAWLMFGIAQLPAGQVVRVPLYYDYATMTFRQTKPWTKR